LLISLNLSPLDSVDHELERTLARLQPSIARSDLPSRKSFPSGRLIHRAIDAPLKTNRHEHGEVLVRLAEARKCRECADMVNHSHAVGEG